MKILFGIFFVVAVGLVSLACLVGAYMSLHDNFFVVFVCWLAFLPSKKRFVCSFSHVDTGFCFCYSCAVQRHTTYCCVCCSFWAVAAAGPVPATYRPHIQTYVYSCLHTSLLYYGCVANCGPVVSSFSLLMLIIVAAVFCCCCCCFYYCIILKQFFFLACLNL